MDLFEMSARHRGSVSTVTTRCALLEGMELHGREGQQPEREDPHGHHHFDQCKSVTAAARIQSLRSLYSVQLVPSHAWTRTVPNGESTTA